MEQGIFITRVNIEVWASIYVVQPVMRSAANISRAGHVYAYFMSPDCRWPRALT